MSKWTIGKRLVARFAAVVAVMLVVGGFAITQVLTIKGDADRVVHDSLPGTATSGKLATLVTENYGLGLNAVHAESP